MLYCTNCADKNLWPKSIFQSIGLCEICGDWGCCNDVPSSKLPTRHPGVDLNDPLSGGFAIKDNYDIPKVAGYVLNDEMGMTSSVNTAEGWKIIKPSISDGLVFKTKKKFWLSIRKAKNCLFSRRNGHMGKLIWGYSICLRLFGKTIL